MTSVSISNHITCPVLHASYWMCLSDQDSLFWSLPIMLSEENISNLFSLYWETTLTNNNVINMNERVPYMVLKRRPQAMSWSLSSTRPFIWKSLTVNSEVESRARNDVIRAEPEATPGLWRHGERNAGLECRPGMPGMRGSGVSDAWIL